MDELQERLELDPKSITTNQVREIAINMLDRTDLPAKVPGASAQSAPVITFNFGKTIKEAGPTIDMEG